MIHKNLTRVDELPPPSSQEGRALHLVDVENLIGNTTFGEVDVMTAAAAYGPVAGIAPRDLVVVASSHFTALATWYGWENARRLVCSGPDGADLALIEVIETENVAGRFDRIVLGSGDKIFAGYAARLQVLGMEVTVVSRPNALSRQLRLAVRDVRYLEVLPELAPDIARRAA